MLLEEHVLILIPKLPCWLLEIMKKKIISSHTSRGGRTARHCVSGADINSKVRGNV